MSPLRAGVAVVALAAALALGAAPAAASFDACTYDSATRTVSATFDTSHDATLRVGAGGEILNGTTPCGAASTANTDEVAVTGTNRSDRVTIDNSGPGGAFRKPGGSDEIHFDVELAGQCEGEVLDWCVDDPQLLKVIGTTGDDDMRAGAGEDGIGINIDASSDVDADILWGPSSFARRLERRGAGPFQARRPRYFDPPPAVELDGGGGGDTLTGLGGSGTGATPITTILRGGPDDDHLVGGGRRDVLYPGGGDDTVQGSPSGTDIVSYADAPSGVTARFWRYEYVQDGFGGRDKIDMRDITTFRGSSHADHIGLSWDGGTILGGDGDDDLAGSPEADALYGEGGNDRIESSFDRTFGEHGDSMHGGRGDDLLVGGKGPDDLSGGPGNDTLEGRAGKGPPSHGGLTFKGGDVLRGGAGDDLLIGGPDADVYYFPQPVGREKDTIAEEPGGGRDLIHIDYYDDYYNRSQQTPATIDLSSPGRWFATSGRRTLRTSERGGAANIENVLLGTDGASSITGNASDNVIQSGGGKDEIDCRGGRDTVGVEPGDRIAHCEVVKISR